MDINQDYGRQVSPHEMESYKINAMDENKYLHRLCRNILGGRFDWRKHCTPRNYFGLYICVQPLFCSYGQIGYSVCFPYSDKPMPEIEYDWETCELTIDEEDWLEYLSGVEN